MSSSLTEIQLAVRSLKYEDIDTLMLLGYEGMSNNQIIEKIIFSIRHAEELENIINGGFESPEKPKPRLKAKIRVIKEFVEVSKALRCINQSLAIQDEVEDTEMCEYRDYQVKLKCDFKES